MTTDAPNDERQRLRAVSDPALVAAKVPEGEWNAVSDFILGRNASDP